MNIRVADDVHQTLVQHLLEDDRKISKFTEKAILEKIEREKQTQEKTQPNE